MHDEVKVITRCSLPLPNILCISFIFLCKIKATKNRIFKKWFYIRKSVCLCTMSRPLCSQIQKHSILILNAPNIQVHVETVRGSVNKGTYSSTCGDCEGLS